MQKVGVLARFFTSLSDPVTMGTLLCPLSAVYLKIKSDIFRTHLYLVYQMSIYFYNILHTNMILLLYTRMGIKLVIYWYLILQKYLLKLYFLYILER